MLELRLDSSYRLSAYFGGQELKYSLINARYSLAESMRLNENVCYLCLRSLDFATFWFC